MTQDENLLRRENIREIMQIAKNWSNLETLISSVTSKLISYTDSDEAIHASLRDITTLTNVDYAFLFQLDESKDLFINTHDWYRERIPSKTRFFQKVELSKYPWWEAQLKKGRVIKIDEITSRSEEGVKLKELMITNDISSLVIYPLFIKTKLIGCMGFAKLTHTSKWNELEMIILKLSSQLIGNTLERQKIEKLLKESEEKYRLIIENINDLIFIIDQQFQIEYINEEMVYKLLGYQISELIGKNSLDFIHPGERERLVGLLRNEVEYNGSKTEMRFKHKRNDWIWFECKGKHFMSKTNQSKWLLSSRDISDRKIVEERYKNLFEKSPNAILLIDFNGKIIDSNSTVERIFGFTKDFFIKKNIDDLKEVFSLEMRHYFKYIFQAYFKNIFPDPIELEIEKPDNEKIWIQVQASIIKQVSKTLVQFIFEDITQKKKSNLLEKKFKNELENEVAIRTKELNDALEQQKLYLEQIVKSSRFKTEFMATMSHELRTPLNAIIGFTDLLLEGAYGDLNEEQEEFISDIKSSADHQLDMINNILDISKIESGQVTLNIQKFSLNSLVNQILSSLKPQFSKKDLEINLKNLNDEIFIYADPIKFREILLNLLSNALKFTMKGKIYLTIQKDFSNWVFKVRDTGIGIDREDFPLIFKEFKRVNSTYVRSVPGTGLGLSLTKRLVELHGGEINFFSIIGSGTTFTFNIPRKWEYDIKEKN
jgi:PAS domain S-box-containing protein